MLGRLRIRIGIFYIVSEGRSLGARAMTVYLRLFAVRKIDHGTISWWPVNCPAYGDWIRLLYPDQTFSKEERFQILCSTYLALNAKKPCSFPDALAQTCWVKKENNGKLRLSFD